MNYHEVLLNDEDLGTLIYLCDYYPHKGWPHSWDAQRLKEFFESILLEDRKGEGDETKLQ